MKNGREGVEKTTIDRREYAELSRKIPALDSAAKVLDGRIQHAKNVASVAIAESLRPYHAELVRDVCKLLSLAHSELVRLQDFKNKFERKGLSYSNLQPTDLRLLGHIEHYLADALRSGHIKRTDVAAGVP